MTPAESPEPGEADDRPGPTTVIARADLPPVSLPGIGTDALLLRLVRADTGATAALSPSLAARPTSCRRWPACRPSRAAPALPGRATTTSCAS